MDEKKSWKRLIFAYAGAGVLVLAIAFFIARSASQNSMIVARGGTTPPPTVVGVYSGIAPDATQQPKAPTDPTPAPPSPSASPEPAKSAAPHPTSTASHMPEEKVAKAAPKTPKHGARDRAKHIVAEANLGYANDGHIVPIEHAEQAAADAPKVEAPVATATPEVVVASTVAPAPATEAPQSNEPIFAPQRIVDAQVRVAVQPEVPEPDRERGEHGESVVLVTIDSKGNVINAVVGTSSGYRGLDRAAMTAARSSQFVAPKINGRPATETYRVVYDFND